MDRAVPTPGRILLVGGGGREHALAIRLAGEPGVTAVVALPGSDAIAHVPGVTVVDGDPLDPARVVAAARAAAADLVVIGPEAPLAAGVTDALEAAGFPAFGPTAAAARIESSKAFCHQVADAAGVRMARGAAFASEGPARAFAAELDAGGHGVVIKADGLAAGKGVTVCDGLAEAISAIAAICGAPSTTGDAPRVRRRGAVARPRGQRHRPYGRDHGPRPAGGPRPQAPG